MQKGTWAMRIGELGGAIGDLRAVSGTRAMGSASWVMRSRT
jgi:hypothetical protein